MATKTKHCGCGKLIWSDSKMCGSCSAKGRFFSVETKKKLSESHRGSNHPNFGKHLSLETRQKQSEAKKGKRTSQFGKHLSEETMLKRRNTILAKIARGERLRKPISEEHRKKLSLTSTGRKMSEKNRIKLMLANKGRKLTEEHRTKISEARIGKKFSPHSMKTKIKMSLAQKGKKFSLEHVEKLTNARNTPEYKENMREKTMIRWNDPSFVEKMIRSNHQFHGGSNELRMKQILIDLGVNFVTQKRITDIKHRYLADFYLPDYNTIIETDGVFWHGDEREFPVLRPKQILQKERDAVRTEEMRDAGYIVFRFWENDFDRDSVYDCIKNLRPVISCVVGVKNG
jgi:very-short-patch-repair endonuclease